MITGDAHEPAPVCPRPGHDRHRVVRDGYQGKGATRRQRWRCVNPYDRTEWHRISPKLNRVVGAEYWCADCSQHVSRATGQPIANSYEFVAAQIATALHEVGKGMTYRQATLAARREFRDRAGQPRRRAPRHAPLPPKQQGQHLRRGVQMGQLVADWVEVFTDAVVPAPTHWPTVVLLDSSKFSFKTTGQQAFEVMFAYGYEAGPNGTLGEGKLLKAVAVKSVSSATWTSFINSMSGSPLTVVSDGAGDLIRAIHWNWGVHCHLRCVWHWEQNLADAVCIDLAAAGYDVPRIERHPLYTNAGDAFRSEAAWNLYKQGLRSEFAGTPGGPAVARWLTTNERLVLNQIRSRGSRPGIESTAPLESHIKDFRNLLNDRAGVLRNRDRTNLLLRLMVGARQPDASVRLWTARLVTHLREHDSRPTAEQRRIAGHLF